jgi:hypothetical protein
MFTGLEVTGLTSFDLSPDGSKIVFDGTEHKILKPAPAEPSPPAPVPPPVPPRISGVWHLNAAESSIHNGSGSDRLMIRQYAQTPETAVQNGQLRAVEIRVDGEWRPHLSVASSEFGGAKRPVYTEENLWTYLHDQLQSKSTISLDANRNPSELDKASFTLAADGQITSTSAITVSPDNSKLMETRDQFDPQGRRVGTDVLVFDRIGSGSALLQKPSRQRTPPGSVSSNPLIGVWALNRDLSNPKQSAGMDLHRYDDLGRGGIGHLHITLDSNSDGAPAVFVSVAVLKSDAPENPTQAFRLSRPFATLDIIYSFLATGELVPGAIAPILTYRAIDSYTSEMMMHSGSLATAISATNTGRNPPVRNVYSRISVSPDGMTLTEVQEELNNSGEPTRETTLVYERIAP